MTKMRVHELAKELGVENKVVIDILRADNIEAKSHMSSVSDEGVAVVKAKLGEKTKSAATAEAEVKAEPKTEPKTEVPVAEATPAEPPKRKILYRCLDHKIHRATVREIVVVKEQDTVRDRDQLEDKDQWEVNDRRVLR